MAEKMALIATRKEVGGWPEAGKKGVLGSVASKHCWKQEVDQWDYCTYISVTSLIEHSFFKIKLLSRATGCRLLNIPEGDLQYRPWVET